MQRAGTCWTNVPPDPHQGTANYDQQRTVDCRLQFEDPPETKDAKAPSHTMKRE